MRILMPELRSVGMCFDNQLPSMSPLDVHCIRGHQSCLLFDSITLELVDALVDVWKMKMIELIVV